MVIVVEDNDVKKEEEDKVILNFETRFNVFTALCCVYGTMVGSVMRAENSRRQADQEIQL